MADDNRNDPLDERLRATFAAERDDMERRRMAGAGRRVAASSPTWLPLAAAAAVIAVLAIGVAIMGSRAGDDEAVDVDVAAQPTEEPDVPAVEASPEPTAQPAATAETVDAQAVPTPVGTPAFPPTVPPAPNECGEAVEPGIHFVRNVAVDDLDGGLVAHTAAGVDEPVTRVLPYVGVVDATGGCVRTSDGAAWYELATLDGSREWVNAAFLQRAEEACLTVGDEPFLHTVAVGEFVVGIAQMYNVPVDELIDANAEGDLDNMMAGQLIRIPAQSGAERSDGWAVFDDQVAFAFPLAATYTTTSRGVVTAGACGSDSADGECHSCVSTGDTALTALPCARSSDGAALPRQHPAGDAASTADHVHDMTAESNGECTRVVVTFGEGANEAQDGPAGTLPPLRVEQTMNAVRIASLGDRFETSFGDPDRVEYPGGIGLLTLSFGFDVQVEFLHRDMEPHVRFFEEPARVVIDLFPTEAPPIEAAPFGERFVLRRPIQTGLDGAGIPADAPITVSGFGRPFEAAGLYRIWSVPSDVEVEAFLADPGEPLHEDFFPTSGWAEAWGQFEVTLPELAPGSYIAVFGELPPTDEIGFYGVGQLFHVYDPDAPPEEPFPEAVLLPDVQLDPEF